MNIDESIKLTRMSEIMIKAIAGETDGKETKESILQNIIDKSRRTTHSFIKIRYNRHTYRFLIYNYSTYQLIDFDPRHQSMLQNIFNNIIYNK